ncbi:hypothetical protein KY289_026618 [Solanum tuberosum]|nr:hypothetical protein KY289_026618 [Solanum tuberosum]
MVISLTRKSEAFANFEVFCRKVQREAGYFITTIHSDHGGEFENKAFEEFCALNGFTQNFSLPRSPQQNGVVERKNCSLQDIARTMLLDRNLPDHFSAETNNLGKFDPRSDEGIFLGYAPLGRDFRVFNKRTISVEESVHVVFHDTNPRVQETEVGDDEITSLKPTEEISKVTLELNTDESAITEVESTTPADKANIPREYRHNASYPENFILGKPNEKIQIRSSLKNKASLSLVSQMEPKQINEAMVDESWIQAMEEELNQCERNQVWTLIERLKNCSVIGTKWVFRNKLDENGKVIHNKARLVAQGYSQHEGIDYDETFAPMERFIKEEVFVKQPPGFENPSFPNFVYKLSKALYGLKQAPKA